MPDLFTHGYLVEWAQLFAAVLGCVFTVAGLRNAVGDSTFLAESNANGAKRLIATSNVYWESIRLSVQVLFVVAGVTSVITAPPPALIDTFEVGVTVNRLCLMGASFLLALKSYLGQRERVVLVKLWLRDTDRRHAHQQWPRHNDRRGSFSSDTKDRTP